jgi:hypothetical protein
VHGRLVRFADNGAWSWFEDERVIVDPAAGRVLVGSCADASGTGGAARDGDIDVAWLDVQAGAFGSFELHDRLQADDHNSPALLLRPDGRYVAMYGTHGATTTSYWRISAPGDPSLWSPTATYDHGAGLTYSNLHHVPDPTGSTAGLTYNFCRARNFDPNVMWSADLGTTWSGGGKLLTEGGSGDRPYVKYDHDGGARVHLITTERHPRNFDNSIYHGYVEAGALHGSTGTVLDANVTDAQGVQPSALTTILQAGSVVAGTVLRRAWTIDVVAEPGGVVRALFQARANGSDSDHRLLHGWFDGATWQVHQVCRLGAYLYAAENDYTGLAALHPDDPTRLYVSTRIDPRTGATTARYELYAGRTADQGRTWAWTPVTEGSTVDNLRPVVPAWDAERTALLWLRGTYTTYTNYDLAVVGTIAAPELPFDAASHHDATPQNTTAADGSPLSATGPSTSSGANDGLWHRRAGVGNGGEVWSASDSGDEDAPALRTRLSGLAPGVHDVYVVFWSRPAEGWSLRAGLAADALRHLEKQSAQSVGSNELTGPIVSTTQGGERLYLAWLGRADVGASGTLDVFVDDIDTGQGATTRTWYDGVAIARVTCAPTARYCAAVASSVGSPARITRAGSCSLARNDLVLGGTDVPSGAWSIFLYGQGRTSVPLADGRLCLATRVGRMGAQQADVLGLVARALDLSSSLGSAGPVAAGETWGFQLWFRDSTPGGANLSDALELTFGP